LEVRKDKEICPFCSVTNLERRADPPRSKTVIRKKGRARRRSSNIVPGELLKRRANSTSSRGGDLGLLSMKEGSRTTRSRPPPWKLAALLGKKRRSRRAALRGQESAFPKKTEKTGWNGLALKPQLWGPVPACRPPRAARTSRNQKGNGKQTPRRRVRTFKTR